MQIKVHLSNYAVVQVHGVGCESQLSHCGDAGREFTADLIRSVFILDPLLDPPLTLGIRIPPRAGILTNGTSLVVILAL